MVTLAIDSSTHQPSVCVADSDKKISEVPVSTDGGPGKHLIPAIENALNDASTRSSEIDLIALSIGPGSFTGLRVGVTVAKSLAYAIDCEVIAFNSLDVVAFQAFEHLQPESLSDTAKLHVVMDAQRKQFFAATYDLQTKFENWPQTDVNIVDQQQWARNLDNDARIDTSAINHFVCGPGLLKIQDRLLYPLSSEIKFKNCVLPDQLWLPRAKTLVAMAARCSRRDDFWKLTPQYYRLSAAEEKRLARFS